MGAPWDDSCSIGQMYKQAAGEAMALYTNAVLQARANQILAESLTPAFLQYKLLEKWQGTPPQFMGLNSLNTLFSIPVSNTK